MDAGKSSLKFWLTYFVEAGVSAESAADYALTFSQHRIRADMLADLSRQHLHELGVTALGDIILLLKHSARSKQQEEPAKEQSRVLPTNIPSPDTAVEKNKNNPVNTNSTDCSGTVNTLSTSCSRTVSVKRSLQHSPGPEDRHDNDHDSSQTVNDSVARLPRALNATKPTERGSGAVKRVVFESNEPCVSSTTSGDRTRTRTRDESRGEDGGHTRFSVTGLGVGGAAQRQCLSSGDEQTVSGSEFLNNLLRRIVPVASSDQLQYQGVLCSKRRRISDPTPIVVKPTPTRGTLVSDRIAREGRSERSVKQRLTPRSTNADTTSLTKSSSTSSVKQRLTQRATADTSSLTRSVSISAVKQRLTPKAVNDTSTLTKSSSLSSVRQRLTPRATADTSITNSRSLTKSASASSGVRSRLGQRGSVDTSSVFSRLG